MIKFTDEEKSLCKQIVERYRREIEYGDWLLNEGGFAKVWPYRLSCKRIDVIPLWTISDCLEFLREKGWYIFKLEQWIGSDTWQLIITNPENLAGNRNKEGGPSKTPLETCLKAVLAILKED